MHIMLCCSVDCYFGVAYKAELFYNSKFYLVSFITACSELWKDMFWALSVCGFLFVYESREPLNKFAPNSHEDMFGSSLGQG